MGLSWADEATGVNTAHNLAVCSNKGNVVLFVPILIMLQAFRRIAGVCDQSFGTCSCLQGFTGTACERLDCDNACSGNGRCFSMQDYASKFRDSNSLSFRYTNVWDSAKITGCVCDEGYFDYQVSKTF